MSAPVATMLANIGRLKVLAAALAEADAVQAQTMLDVRHAVGLVDAVGSTTTRDAILNARAAILQEAQRAANERRRIRRDAIASDIRTIARDLVKLSTIAEADLVEVARQLCVDTQFAPGERELIGRAT